MTTGIQSWRADRPKSLRKWPMVIVVLIGALLVGASFFVESHWGLRE